MAILMAAGLTLVIVCVLHEETRGLVLAFLFPVVLFMGVSAVFLALLAGILAI